MRIVIVTHYFPPIAGPGTRRVLGWCNGFTSSGEHEVVVVTPRADPRDAYYQPDEAYDGAARVVRVPIFDPSRWLRASSSSADARHGLGSRLRPWLLLPDQRRLANRALVAAAQGSIGDGDALLITTSPYNSVHLAGLTLKRRAGPRVRWVADFRDDWFHPVFFPLPTEWHRRRNEFWERQILDSADGMVAVSPQTVAKIRARHPRSFDEPRWRIIANGFDPTGVEDILEAPAARRNEADFHVLFSGTLWPDHPLDAFVGALETVARQTGRRIRLELAGRMVQPVPSPAPGSGLELVYSAWKPYREALTQSRQADLLLVHTGPERQDLKIKVFDCAAVRRPVFVIGPEDSETVRLIRRHVPDPLVARQEDGAAMVAQLQKLLAAGDPTAHAFAGLPPEYDRLDQSRQLLEWSTGLPVRG